MLRSIAWCATTAALLASPGDALAVDHPVTTRAQLLRQDLQSGYAARLGKIQAAPATGRTIPMPSGDPRITGGTIRLFKPGAATGSRDVSLPAARWLGLGNPAGSAGWRYKGVGSVFDPCRVVLVKEKLIRAVCTGPGAFESPTSYSLPIADDAAAWELRLGTDRYCGQSSENTAADIKRDDGLRGMFKAVKAAAPASCPACEHDPCTTGDALLGSCGSCTARVCAADPFCCQVVWDRFCVERANTLCDDCNPSPYGSANQAFLHEPPGLLD